LNTKLIKLKFLLVFCMLLVSVFLSSSSISAFAVETDSQVIATTENPDEGLDGGQEDPELDEEPVEPDYTVFEGFQVSDSVMTDRYLYSALLALYRRVDSSYTGSVIYSDMFKNFETINLDDKNITSLAGFEKLELDNLISFSANSNEISEFDKSFLRYIDEDKFTSLSLAGNELYEIDLSDFENLTYVDLSSNQLDYINFGAIEGKTLGTRVNFNVANNELDSISDIVLPSKRIGHIELNIFNNNITDLTESYFTDFYTMHIGIQGFATDTVAKVDTANNLKIYPFNIDGLSVKIYKTDGAADELVATITDADITENYLKMNLAVGEYEYVYYLNNEKIDPRYDYKKMYFVSNEVNVIPQKAKYLFTFKGKNYEEIGKVTGKVSVTLSSVEEGATIHYQVNGGEWIEGTVVECDKGGSYSIKVKTIINGVESDIENIWVRTSLNLYVSDWLMLILLLFLSLVLFLVVIPIISKKYFKRD